MIFGTNGQINIELQDGDDFDDETDGEIVWGGNDEAAGGSEWHALVDITNYDPQSGTDTFTLTYTFQAAP